MRQRTARFPERLYLRAPLATAAGALLLAGCSVARPLEVLPTTAQFSELPASAIYLPPEPADGPASGFRTAFAGALQRAGVALDPQARLVADVSLAEGPAEIGIARLPAADQAGQQTVAWLAQPRDKRLLDKCPAQRLKAVASLFDRQTGERVMRSESVAVACTFSAADRQAAADALVADMLARRGS